MIDTGLQDKVVLVTGANHGIGAAAARAFAAQGPGSLFTISGSRSVRRRARRSRRGMPLKLCRRFACQGGGLRRGRLILPTPLPFHSCLIALRRRLGR